MPAVLGVEGRNGGAGVRVFRDWARAIGPSVHWSLVAYFFCFCFFFFRSWYFFFVWFHVVVLVLLQDGLSQSGRRPTPLLRYSADYSAARAPPHTRAPIRIFVRLNRHQQPT